MDRLFLDANILFSAAWGSPTALRLWRAATECKRAELLTSAYALDEARRNLDDPSHRARLELLARDVVLVPEAPDPSLCPVSLHSKDRPVLMAAVLAGATHLLTGDTTHFGGLYGTTVYGVLVSSLRQYLSGPVRSGEAPPRQPGTSNGEMPPP